MRCAISAQIHETFGLSEKRQAWWKPFKISINVTQVAVMLQKRLVISRGQDVLQGIVDGFSHGIGAATHQNHRTLLDPASNLFPGLT